MFCSGLLGACLVFALLAGAQPTPVQNFAGKIVRAQGFEIWLPNTKKTISLADWLLGQSERCAKLEERMASIDQLVQRMYEGSPLEASDLAEAKRRNEADAREQAEIERAQLLASIAQLQTEILNLRDQAAGYAERARYDAMTSRLSQPDSWNLDRIRYELRGIRKELQYNRMP